MPETKYRMWFGDTPAKTDALDLVDEIVVEQEMDMIWEARIKLAICVDETGHWRHLPDTFARPFSRVRVELKAGDGGFVPLIDGPVAGFNTALDSQPGRSTATLVVRDDSVFLNREESVEVFEQRVDSDVAEEIFGRFPQIGDTRVEATTAPARTTVRRRTAMQFVRELARAHAYHAYVLPGDERGHSIGCFLPDPASPGDLPPLTLLGDDRNLTETSIVEDSESPERTRGRQIRVTDQSIVSAETSASDLTFMRDLPPLDDTMAVRLLAPADNDREDPTPRARARARRSSYAYRLQARVIPGCYTAVLAPYQKVTVRAGDTPHSGAYLLTKVTHRLTPSVWTQEFEARGDSRADVSAPAAAGAPGGGGLSVSFSASISVF